MWQGGHVGSQYHIIIFSRRVYMKIEFSSQMREMLWFLTTNMATVTSRADQQYATCISPIKHLICPPKFYISIVFNFSWDGCNIQEKWKTKVMQNVGRQIRCIMGDVQVAYSPSYSYRWKRGWSWPCFDTTLPAWLCKSCFSYANWYFWAKFTFGKGGGLYQDKVNLSLTFTQRLGY